MKRGHNFLHLARRFVCTMVVVALFFSGSALALSRYRYESVFPSIQQPWHFKTPSSVAMTENGYLLVADTDNHRIVKLNQDGQLVTTWGQYGHGDGQFDQPSAIALDNEGNCYVLDAATGNNKISKFDPNGVFLFSWGKSGDGNNDGEGEFFFHQAWSDIIVSPDDEIFISDTGNDRIQKFTTAGDFIDFLDGFTGECSSNCQLTLPSGLAFDDAGNLFILHIGLGGLSDSSDQNILTQLSASGVYQNTFNLSVSTNDAEGSELSRIAINQDGVLHIIDMGNGRILRYSFQGEYLGAFGHDLLDSYQLASPSDLCFGEDGKIYIADSDNDRIVKLSKERKYINSWQSYGNEPGMFHGPSGIVVDPNGSVFIADTDNHRLQKLDSDGNVQMILGSEGSESGQFNRPRNLAIDSSGNIYVLDKKNRRIQKFDSTGSYILEWGGGSGIYDGEFKDPVGIAVDLMDNIYIADSQNFRIQKFTPDGIFITKWGEPCNESPNEGCLLEIEDIAVDINGNVYVSDHYIEENDAKKISRVLKFTSSGEFIEAISEHGTGLGELDYPFGLDVDIEGNLYVADQRNYRIQKFSSEGVFLDSFGEFGAGPGQFLAPVDVAVTEDGDLFVLDAFTNTVQRFSSAASDHSTSSDIKRKAIIIAGGGPYQGNTLWNTTRSCANFAYRTLRHKGYTKEDIYYLCDDDGLDIDGNGLFDDIYGKPTHALVNEVITQTVIDADALLLYFTDHGGHETFQLSSEENLSAETLDGWLDAYESASKGHSTLIYDACQSGSFIPAMTPYADGSRTVMTSSGSDEYAYFVSFGTISFSEYFWTAIFNGHDLTSAFQQAQNGITQLELSQKPHMDANGNGIPNEDDDYGQSLSSIAVNGEKEMGGKGRASDLPVIGEADAITLVNESGQSTIEVREVSDADGIERVWATIIAPDYNFEASDVPVTDLPELELQPVSGGEVGESDPPMTYRVDYNGFNVSGTYRVTVYARDVKGNNAVPVTMAFVTDAGALSKAVVISTDSKNYSRANIYRSLADQAIHTLKAQGFSDDRILQLNAPSSAQVASAVTEWALDNKTLTLYFVGDGDVQGIPLNGGTKQSQEGIDRITPSLLKEWLDTYQALSDGRVVVIIDADNSGQFINALADAPGEGQRSIETSRVIVTSTDGTGSASFEGMGLSSFSSFFWNAVNRGANIKDAFFSTSNAISYVSQSLAFLGLVDDVQSPQLDDNGNGIANEDDEGAMAAALQIGLGIITGADDYITADILPDFELNGESTAMLTVKNLRSASEIQSVWAMITPPALSEDDLNISSFSLPVQYLIPDGSGGYQWMYSNFFQEGSYLVDFFAKDTAENVALLGRTTVVQNRQLAVDALVQVGGGQGFETMDVSADQPLKLDLDINPGVNALTALKQEWVVVALGRLEGEISFYLFSPLGLVDPFDSGLTLSDYTFPFDHSRSTMTLGTLDLASIGLSSGDFFAYAYVYTDTETIQDITSAPAIYGNTVFLTVQ